MNYDWTAWQGRKIDNRFELGDYLGGSQDSAVFVTSIDSGSDQKACIKLIRAKAKNVEAQLLLWAAVKDSSHPHIIRMFGAGECTFAGDRWSYVVMEYAEENLSTILSARSLTPAETLEMLDPMLEALVYLHSRGFVHGHIKPSNIMAVNDQLKIASDGIVRVGQSSVDLAKPSQYLPPEASSGKAATSIDVWSVGATLVETLTQRAPSFENDQQKQSSLGALPSPFADICQRCLRTDPAQRCTIDEIQNLLHPPSSPEAQVENIAAKSSGPHHYYWIAIVAVLVLIAAGVVLSKHLGSRAGTAAEKTQLNSSSEQHPVTEAAPAATSDQDGKVIQQVLPDVSKSALRTIQGTIKIKVRVHVDSTGAVEKVKLQSAGPSGYFARKTTEAAQQWKFAAPLRNGKPIPSEWNLEFQLKRTGVKVQATEVTRDSHPL